MTPTLLTEAGDQILARDGNTFQRAGTKVEISLGRGNILGGVQLNRDRIRGVSRPFEAIISLVEARYVVYPWLIPAVRFENLNPNFGVSFNRTTLHGSLLARANVRISVEGVVSQNSETDPIRDYRRYDSDNDARFQVRVDFGY